MQGNGTAPGGWTKIINNRTQAVAVNLSQLWRYRDLISLFVKRDFIAVYKQTMLGPLWHIIQPVMTTVVFALVFSKLARISTDGVPPLLFYLCNIIAWNLFSTSVVKTSDTFIANAHIFGKVYFPRLVIPVSIVISNCISFLIQLLILAFLWSYYKIFTVEASGLGLQSAMLLVPLLLLIILSLALGFGIVISSLTTRYRDLKFAVGFIMQLAMYSSAVVFPVSSLSGTARLLILLNPMTPIIEAFRFAVTGKGMLDFYWLGYSFIFSIIVLIIGVNLFNRIEKDFMDTV